MCDVYCFRDHEGPYGFLKASFSNFVYGKHSFRVNEVLMPTGYDVIVSPPPGGAALTCS